MVMVDMLMLETLFHAARNVWDRRYLIRGRLASKPVFWKERI